MTKNARDFIAADGVRVLRARPALDEPDGAIPKVMEVLVYRHPAIELQDKVLETGVSYYFGVDENGLLKTNLFMEDRSEVEAIIRPKPPSTGRR